MKTEFLTPVGRLVQGDPFEAQTKNMKGQPLTTQAGHPTQRYFVAVAFRKDDPAFGKLWQVIEGVGRSSFPALNIAPPWDAACRFSWKVADGDGVDDNGKPNANKEGFAGHWVVKFSSSFAPRCFHAGHYQPHEQIQDPKTIKRGYFVRIAGTIEGNANMQKPGVYMNLGMVELAGQGPEITSGPDAAAVFGGVAAVLPAGASPLPMHAAAGGPPGLPGMVAHQGLPSQMPAAALPGQMPGLPVMQPNPGIVGNGLPGALPVGLPGVNPGFATSLTTSPSNGMPVVVQPNPAFLNGPALPLMQQPAAPQMTAKAGGFTYEQYRAQGYTDEILRAQGVMI